MKGACGLPEQPPLQHFMLLLGCLAHHLPGETYCETPSPASTPRCHAVPAPKPRLRGQVPCSALPTSLPSLVLPCPHLPVTGLDSFDHHGLLGVHLRATLLWAGLCKWEDTVDGNLETCGIGAQQ